MFEDDSGQAYGSGMDVAGWPPIGIDWVKFDRVMIVSGMCVGWAFSGAGFLRQGPPTHDAMSLDHSGQAMLAMLYVAPLVSSSRLMLTSCLPQGTYLPTVHIDTWTTRSSSGSMFCAAFATRMTTLPFWTHSFVPTLCLPAMPVYKPSVLRTLKPERFMTSGPPDKPLIHARFIASLLSQYTTYPNVPRLG